MADLSTQIDEDRLEQVMGTMLQHFSGAATIGNILVGHKVGLFQAMHGKGAVSADELANAAGTNPRLTREWLDQQASAGITTYDATADTYELPLEAGMALADPSSPVYVAGGSEGFVALFADIDKVATAFQGDGGVAWGDHHESLFRGTREFFRPAYEHHLIQEWIPALDGVQEKLEAGGTVADIGCGQGISTIKVAEAFPNAIVIGFDLHEPSIEEARKLAADAGVSNASFEVAGAKEFTGSFDLVMFCDCLHDMGDPVGIAAHAKGQLADGGSIMLIEPWALDTRQENHEALGAMLYGFSTFFCTPCSLSQEVGRGLGAQSGEPGMRAVFDEAGFGAFRRAAETPFNIIYQAQA